MKNDLKRRSKSDSSVHFLDGISISYSPQQSHIFVSTLLVMILTWGSFDKSQGRFFQVFQKMYFHKITIICQVSYRCSKKQF